MTGRHLDHPFLTLVPSPAQAQALPGSDDGRADHGADREPARPLTARLPREVDALNEARVRLDLLTMLHAFASHVSGVILDMTHTSFIDSAGLRALMVVQSRADQLAAPLCIAGPQRHVRRLLALVDITGRIPVFDSVDAALTASSARPEPLAAGKRRTLTRISL